MAKTSARPTDAPPKPARSLDLPALESWLWEAACVIRGPLDASKFKDYILPLIFLKWLSDVFDDELAHFAREFGDAAAAARLVEQDHKLVRFFVPRDAQWSNVSSRTTKVGEYLTDAVRAVARQNTKDFRHYCVERGNCKACMPQYELRGKREGAEGFCGSARK